MARVIGNSFGVNTSAVATTVVVPVPSEAAELDVLVLFCAKDLNTGTFTVPTGWVSLVDTGAPGGHRALGCVRISSTPVLGTSVTVTHTAETSTGSIVCVRDANLGTPATFQTQTDVNSGTDVITTDASHGFATADAVYYLKRGGSNGIGLTDGNLYFVRNLSSTTLAMYPTATDATNDTNRINLTAAGSDETHYIYDADFYVDVHGRNDNTTAGFTPQCPSVTTTVAKDLLLFFVSMDGNAAAITNYPGAMFINSFDAASTPSQAAAWSFAEATGATPTQDFMSTISDDRCAWTLALKPASGAPVPTYIDPAGSNGVVLNPLHATSNTAFNNVFEDMTAVATTITAFDGRNITNDALAALADWGLNNFNNAIQGSPAVATNWQGARLDFGTGSAPGTVNLSASLILGTFMVQNPKDASYDGGKLSEGGFGIILQDTDGDWRGWVIGGIDSKPSVLNRSVFAIDADNSTTAEQTSGTFTSSAVRKVCFLYTDPRVATVPVYSYLVRTQTLKVVGGSDDLPADVLGLEEVGNSFLFPLVQRVGAAAVVCYTPVQLGGADASYIDLDASTIQFPEVANFTKKEVLSHHVADGSANSFALSYNLLSGDTLIHTNAIVSSPSKYTWEIASGSSASASYDFSGLTIVGADPVTLRDVTTFAEMNFTRCGLITLNSASLEDSTIGRSTATTGAVGFPSAAQGDNVVRISFVNNNDGDIGHSIRISANGTYTFEGHTFVGGGPSHFGFHTQTDVDAAADEVDHTAHGYATGDAVYYQDQGGSDTIGLTDGNLYYVRAVTADSLAFYTTKANALADTSRVGLSDGSAGQTHYLYSAKADVFVDASGSTTINVTSGDAPTVRLRDGATITINNTVTFTVNGLVAGTELRIFRNSDGVELAGTESSGTSFDYDYNYTGDVPIRIMAQKVGYLWQERADTLTNLDRTRTLAMEVDFNYVNNP